MKRKKYFDKQALTFVLIASVIYVVFVGIYVFLVLHFLSGWLKQLLLDRPDVYALIALTLMITQAVALEVITGFVLSLTRQRQR
jgi:hypothetical protein